MGLERLFLQRIRVWFSTLTSRDIQLAVLTSGNLTFSSGFPGHLHSLTHRETHTQKHDEKLIKINIKKKENQPTKHLLSPKKKKESYLGLGQAWEPELESQHPHEKTKHGYMHLWS